jgi:hypothetical protein
MQTIPPQAPGLPACLTQVALDATLAQLALGIASAD